MQPVDIDTVESLSEVVLPASYSPRLVGVGQKLDFLYPYGGCCLVQLKLIKTSKKDYGSFRCTSCNKDYFSPTGRFPHDWSAIEQIWLGGVKTSHTTAINNIVKTISKWTLIDSSELEVEVE